MKTTLWCIVIAIFGIGFSACSAFYTRHYTRGMFYNGLAHQAKPAIQPKKSTLPVLVKQLSDSTAPAVSGEDVAKEKALQQREATQAAMPEDIKTSGMQKFNGRFFLPAPVLRKTLKPVQGRIQASQHGESVLGKAVFYILALVLAVGILVLAIYFLPSIMIPSAAASAFATVVTIGAIVVVCVFAYLIYTLIRLLTDLFRREKTREEDEF